mmetsp:Transcript_58190/g.138567  ORF Transcript_58190/g.138567 Transcript_58190/m.138567 type:complete len:651 (+) Transcript_58190:168-2120(+)|eukprot:CAMPEP_0178440774 /NCGR_PEP_ID=MMETSP0689_2-20121128/37004_1 /TAXON_ID=160604 /ORGANISM="Amphidinium massartii, Strain CS-259" /LENGTH=650 /DNA_ID=CAMNT_0020063663 /DNA_START=79 /DNA_END=2031 /DNA_ORIENTATION=-
MAAQITKLFEENVSVAGGWLYIKLSGKALVDDHMVQLAAYLETVLPDSGVWANVDLSQNGLRNAGLSAVLDVLEKKSVSCKCFKLYKNELTDEGASRLAKYVKKQPDFVEEVHLSHNQLTGRSLVALCMALVKHDRGAYPFQNRTRLFIPCWVRMEYNNIAKPQELVDMLKRDGAVRICTAENRDVCGPWRCCSAGTIKEKVPIVHLFAITAQSRQARPSATEDAEVAREMKAWGASVKPLGGPAVRSVAPAATPTYKATTSNGTPTARGSVWGSSQQQAADGAEARNGSEVDANGARRGGGYDADAKAATAPVAKVKAEKASHQVQDAEKRGKAGQPSKEDAMSAGSNGSTTASGGDEAAGHVAEDSQKLVQTMADGQLVYRIRPEQLEANMSTGQFTCPLCGLLLWKPLVAVCSHMYCEKCFNGHVQAQVARMKKDNKPVSLIPCPQPQCDSQLRKADVQLLESSTFQLMQRLFNNQRVRCVHHCGPREDQQWPWSSWAARIAQEQGVTCSWTGELCRYQEHMKRCPVQMIIEEQLQAQAEAEQLARQQALEESSSDHAQPPADEEPQQNEDAGDASDGEIRRVRYDYNPREGEGQLPLTSGAFVKVFEVTESGWAAGIAVDPQTLQEAGDPGWFPDCYLYPASEAVA